MVGRGKQSDRFVCKFFNAKMVLILFSILFAFNILPRMGKKNRNLEYASICHLFFFTRLKLRHTLLSFLFPPTSPPLYTKPTVVSYDLPSRSISHSYEEILNMLLTKLSGAANEIVVFQSFREQLFSLENYTSYLRFVLCSFVLFGFECRRCSFSCSFLILCSTFILRVSCLRVIL